MDVDKLISLIHGNPSLWDKKNSEYADNTARARSWVEVGKQMYPDFENLTGEGKTQKMTLLKDKWRHIRDNYVRYMNGKKSGEAASKKKKKKKKNKYIYAEALEFLRDSVEKRRTSGSFEQPDDSLSSSVEDPPHQVIKVEELLLEEDVVEERLTDSQATVPSTPKFSRATPPPPPTSSRQAAPKRKLSDVTPFQTALLNKIDAPVTFSAEPEDPDKAYLFSLLPNYKKLSDEDKLDFQSTVITFLRSRMRRTPSPALNQLFTPYQLPFNHISYQHNVHPPMGPTSMAPPAHVRPRTESLSSSSSGSSHPSEFQTPEDYYQQL